MTNSIINSKKIFFPNYIGFEILKDKKKNQFSCLIFKREEKCFLIHKFPIFIEIFPFWNFKINQKGILFYLKKNYLNSNYKKYFELENKLFLNKIQGLITFYEKVLCIIGIGFKFQLVSEFELYVFAGFSHVSIILIPQNIICILENSNKLILKSSSKEKLGEFAAKIKNIKPVEFFKGKGIKYENEEVKLKVYKKVK